MSPTTDLRLGNDGDGGPLARSPEGVRRQGAPGSWLVARLPAVYREMPGVLAPLLEVAAEAIDGQRDLLGRLVERRRLLDLDRPVLLGAERARAGSGTLGDLKRLLEETGPPVPRIALGLEAVPRDGRWVQILRSRGPAVLLVFERPREGTEAPGPIIREIPAEYLPVRVRTQAIVIRRMPSGRRLLAGEVVQGSLLWTRPPRVEDGFPHLH